MQMRDFGLKRGGMGAETCGGAHAPSRVSDRALAVGTNARQRASFSAPRHRDPEETRFSASLRLAVKSGETRITALNASPRPLP